MQAIEPPPRLLWHCEYWDGPLSGIALHEGRKVWFWCADDVQEHRLFHVFPLTDEEIAEEDRWHALFCEHVGTHTDYDEEGRRDVTAIRPHSEWNKFYDAAKDRPPRTYHEREAIGYFVM